ncbi:DUF418 domain-containing protein [Sandaracinobacteroides saxicola]|uniref:DUF418 domain-containing protein n=1 Tax=Sandaracinobacteroides saxicola TaxID=2759707 RepID=A0A7G5IHA9_9SPHN|nr:DUF418 domain-containing protein [Sandaracinobacteroides saxicola]QMW22751.1 DUF418 domain-containing protein [Sandaracinobacteroides saxicola]
MTVSDGKAGGRLQSIDALRALALFGVIVMNFGAMVMRFDGPNIRLHAGGADLAAMAFSLILIQGKARMLFAMLFGMGIAISLARGAASGRPAGIIHAQRMAALFLIGVLNQLFLFWGDILATYAILGLLLWFARDWRPAALLRVGLLLVLGSPLLLAAIELLAGPVPSLVPLDGKAFAAAGRALLLHGDWLDRLDFFAGQAWFRRGTDTAHAVLADITLLGTFLIGAWVARVGLLTDPAAHRPLLRRVAIGCIPIGLLVCIVNAARLGGIALSPVASALVSAAYVGIAIFAAGYAALFTLWFARGGRRVEALLAPAGRMGLTNYLASGAIGCALFYGHGLALMGDVGMLDTVLLAAATFALLLAVSHLWLGAFRLGPAEWLWRWLAGARLSRRRPVEAH